MARQVANQKPEGHYPGESEIGISQRRDPTPEGRHPGEGRDPRTEKGESGTKLSKEFLSSAQRRNIKKALQLSDVEAQLNPNLILPKKGNPSTSIPPLAYTPQEHTAWVYILTDVPNGTLYIGVTNHLPRRMTEHKSFKVDSFTKQHKLARLVYFEGFATIAEAIAMEKKMKNWPRSWKIRRILTVNSQWEDLTPILEI